MATTLHDKAIQAANGNPEAFLDMESVFGQLKASKQFVTAFTLAYQKIEKQGVEKSIEDVNNPA